LASKTSRQWSDISGHQGPKRTTVLENEQENKTKS